MRLGEGVQLLGQGVGGLAERLVSRSRSSSARPSGGWMPSKVPWAARRAVSTAEATAWAVTPALDSSTLADRTGPVQAASGSRRMANHDRRGIRRLPAAADKETKHTDAVCHVRQSATWVDQDWFAGAVDGTI
jgi:hypothetical protein